MNGKKQAADFRNNYKLKAVNSAELCRALREQGYTIIEFNGLSDRKAVADLIDALQLREQAANSRCFVYQDSNNRLVFLHEDLNEKERTIVLAHEEGHILNRHMNRESIVGEDVIEEFEANEFAHYLLLGKPRSTRRRAIVPACVICVLICVVSGLILLHHYNRAIYTDNFYRVSDGKKYHLQDCIYVKDRRDIMRLTWEEYKSGEFTACSVCTPDARKTD